MQNLRIENLPIEALTPYERNTRAHGEDDLQQIALSIQRYGFNDPIGVWSDRNIVVEGHGRLLAAKSLGMTTVPCIRLDHLTDEQRREYGIMHNKTAELSDWDFENLEAELAELDLSAFGLQFNPDGDGRALEDTEEALLAAVEEDEAPEPPNDDPERGDVEQPTTRRGEIWKLGQHRLMCGDSTEAADVAALLDGETADCIVTDPPYNVAVKNELGKTLQNDDLSEAAFSEFLRSAFSIMADGLKAGGAFYVWHSSNNADLFETALDSTPLQRKAQLIWVKHTIAPNPLHDYQQRHEPCWYGWKQGAAHYFTRERAGAITALEGGKTWADLSKAELVAALEQVFNPDDGAPTSVIYEKRPLTAGEHPTMKPVRLFARLIRNSTRPGEIVLDPFAGSGTTMIAAEQLGRPARLMELDPRYCDVIIARYEKFTGQKAQRIR